MFVKRMADLHIIKSTNTLFPYTAYYIKSCKFYKQLLFKGYMFVRQFILVIFTLNYCWYDLTTDKRIVIYSSVCAPVRCISIGETSS